MPAIFMIAAGFGRAGTAEETAKDLADRVIVLANAGEPESIELAHYYAEKRGIPEANIVALKLPLGESITWTEYIATLHNPLMEILSKQGWIDGIAMAVPDKMGRRQYAISGHRISYLAVCRGVPLKIQNDPERFIAGQPFTAVTRFKVNGGAVDAELALLPAGDYPINAYFPNPLFNQDRPSVFASAKVIKVSRLDGPTLRDAKSLVDQALAGERAGLIGRAYVDIGGPHGEGDGWLEETAKEVASLGFDSDVDRKRSTLETTARFDAPVLYFGWYENRLNGPMAAPGFRFPPGAVALHIHSFSAPSLRNPGSGWVAPLVARGVSATFGNVDEPYLQLTHQPQRILRALARGWTLGDAAAYSIIAYSWQGIVVGDPLFRPFAVPFEEQWRHRDEAPDWQEPYLVLRRLRQLQAAGQIDEAFALVAKEMKTKPSLPITLALAALQAGAGRTKEAKNTLTVFEQLPLMRGTDVGLFGEAARQLLKLGDATGSSRLYERMLANKTLSKEARIELLAVAKTTAEAAKDFEQAGRWESELTVLKAPVSEDPAAEKKPKKKRE